MTRSCPRQGKVAPLGDERGSLPRATRGCVVLNSPSQTGKVPGPNTDAGRIGLIIHWALKSKNVPTSEARLYGFLSSNARFKGVNLAPKEKVVRIC